MYKAGILLKKLGFVLLVSVLICGGLFWGIRSILQINTAYEAAIATTRDIGIYAQRIASYSERLLNSQNPTVYRANQEMLESLVRKLETNHMAMTQGVPMLAGSSSFSGEIKAVYYSMPTNLVNQVRDFIFHSKQLSQTPFSALHRDDPHANYLRIMVQGSLIQSVSQVIQEYLNESDARITRSILILAVLLLAAMILAVPGYFLLLNGQAPVVTSPAVPQKSRSVSSVLGGVSVYPGKTEATLDSGSENDFSARHLVRN